MEQAGSLSPQGNAEPGLFTVWMQASRAWTLGMPFMSITVGTFAAVYHGHFALERYIAAAIAAMALQAGANMVNDYYDFVSGTDSADWQSPENFGPGLVIQRGYLQPTQVWTGGMIALAIGSVIGLGLAYVCGWPILVLGIVGVLGAYFYTGAPFQLAYRGLGDLMVFALMGPGYVLGAYYVQALNFSWLAMVVSLSMGLLCSGVLQANNLRDIDNDARHGKHTMAVLIGRRSAIAELFLSDFCAYLATIAGVAVGLIPWPALAVLVTVPRALKELQLVSDGADAESHNRAMNLSGQLQFEFGLILAIAFLIAHLFGW